MPFLVVIGAVVLVLATVAVTALWWAYAAVVLWGWFLVPLGAPVVGIAHMYGVKLFVSVVSGLPAMPKEEKSAWERAAIAFLAPGFALAFGYVAKSFM